MLIKRKSIRKEMPARDSGSQGSNAARKIKYAPVTLSEQEGIRYLHFGTPWIQGAMRLRKPDRIELEYARQMMAWMLFNQQPRHIVQLGLGTGALTKFCYRHFPQANVTAIELNPAVIAVCDTMFHLPRRDDRLKVLEMDAMDYVCDSSNHGSVDAIQADLYDASASGPVLDTLEFYQGCSRCLTPHGILTVNLFGDHPSYGKNLQVMRLAFDKVVCLPETERGNVVAIGFRTAPVFDFVALHERAQRIEQESELAATAWVSGLMQATSTTIRSHNESQ